MVTRAQRRVRTFLISGLVAFVGGASAQGAWDGLPAQVVATIERRVASAVTGPEVRLAQQRRERAQAASVGPLPDWEASVGARSGGASVHLHGRGSLSIDLVDPSHPRRLAAARAAATSAALDAWLAAHDAGMDALTTWLAAWAARERVDLAHAAAEAPVSDPSEARRRDAWRDRLPTLELEARIWEDRLHALGVPSPIVWPTFDGWRRWASAPWNVGLCTAAPVEVRVARAEVERLRGDHLAASHAAILPSLRLGMDLSVGVPLDGIAPVDASGRLWLRLGAPSAGPARGSLEVAADGHGAQLELRVGNDRGGDPAGSRDLAIEAAEALLAESLLTARERQAMAHASWSADVTRLAAAPSALSAADAALVDVEALLDVVASTVTAVHLRAESRSACLEVPSPLDPAGVVAGP